MTKLPGFLLFSCGVALACCGVSCSSESGGGGNKIRMAALENKAGQYIEPSIASGQAALAAARLPEDLIAWASDPEGKDSYPIVSYTWIMCYKKYPDARKAAALRDVLHYCVTDGQKQSEALGYIPLPLGVVQKVKAAVGNIRAEGEEKAGEGQVKLNGAGASFPAPLYLKWFKNYNAAHPQVQIDYQSVGSGSGVKDVIDKTVDFGASDAAMTPQEIAKVEGGVQLLPMTAGSIVLAYNVEGVESLRLSRAAYAAIFLGKITRWDDPAIAATNPGVKLPASEINVVVRADSSGTSFVFSKHLSAISAEFAKSPGANKMPNWPVGTRAKGNEGVAASLATTPGSIGYIEYGYAKNAE
jgi:ABC-type phosphate transport system substrate-binding protein